MRPQTLRLLERLIGEVSGQSFRIETPFVFLTKAQSLAYPGVRRFADGFRDTFSCDRFPDHFEGKRQCGVYSSCVLRRMALEAAGLTTYDPADGYAFDSGAPDATPKPSAAFVLDKIGAQADYFTHVLGRSDNPWRLLTGRWPELRDAEVALIESGGLSAEVRPHLLDLLGRHAREWQEFSGHRALDRYLAS